MVVPIIMALTRSSDRLEHALGYAASLFVVAAITDFLDGYLARRWHVESVLGAFLDTTADKLLVTGTLLALTSIGRVSIWAAVVIMMREFAVMGLRGLVALGGGMVKPSTWGKIKATAQYAAIGLAFMRLPDRWGPMYLDQWAMWIAVIITIASAWGYFSAFCRVVASTRCRTGPVVTVAITGATGVVGGAILRHLLADGSRSAGSGPARSDSLPAGVEPVLGTFSTAKSLERCFAGVDTVYHVAGVNRMCAANPDDMYRVNVDGTQLVAEEARDARLVFTSSAATLGEAEGESR